MTEECDIWEQRGTLTMAHDERRDAALSPLPGDRAAPRPLREILGSFLSAAPAERERFTLILENGQAFSADDIEDLLARPDSPFR